MTFRSALCALLLCIGHGFGRAGTDSTALPFSLSAGYANDDLFAEHALNDLLGAPLLPSEDDRVSTTLFLSAAAPYHSGLLTAHLLYYICTDRRTGRRMDLVVFRSQLELRAGHALLSGGVGLFYAGDAGGEGLQNGYHRLFGYPEVAMPYTDRRNRGLSMTVRTELPVSEQEGNGLVPYLGAMAVTGSVFPGYGDAGAAYRWRSEGCNAEVAVGYRGRFGIPPELSRSAGSSPYYGVLAGFPLFGSCRWNFWFTKGQYGIPHAVQFGSGIGWDTDLTRPLRIADIMAW